MKKQEPICVAPEEIINIASQFDVMYELRELQKMIIELDVMSGKKLERARKKAFAKASRISELLDSPF